MLLCLDGEQRKSFDPQILAFLRNGYDYNFSKLIQRYRLGNFTPEFYKLRDGNQATFLHHAAESGTSTAVSYLLELKCEIDAQDLQGKTPLMLAVAGRHEKVFQLLLEANADVDIVNRDGKNALQMLFELEVPASEMLRILFQRVTWQKIIDSISPDILIKKFEEAGFTLKHAVTWGIVELCDFLFVRNRAKLNDYDPDSDQTLLHTAVIHKQAKIAKLLIEYGVDVDVLNRNKNPPLYYLYSSKDDEKAIAENLEVLKAFMSRATLITTCGRHLDLMHIHRALVYACNDAIQVILQRNIDLNATDHCARTVFHYLAANCNIDLFQLMRGRKFNVNAKSNSGGTPLHWAASKRILKNIKFLLENGANVNEADNFGRTALFDAFDGKFSETLKPSVEILLEYGADPQTCVLTRCAREYNNTLQHKNTRLTIFNALSNDCFELAELIIARLVVIQALGTDITEIIRSKIKLQSSWVEYFDKCERQVKMIKKITIYGDVTLFRFLAENERKLIAYVRNEELVVALEKIIEEFEEKSPYLDLIRKRFAKAIQMSALREKAIITVQRLINLENMLYYDIAESIVDYFNNEDIKILNMISYE